MSNEIQKSGRDINVITAEILTIKREGAEANAEFMRRQAYRLYEIGRRLCEAKEIVPAGQWLAYIEEQLDYKTSTVENLMKIYREFGDDQISLEYGAAPAEIFSALNQSQMVALFGLSQAERVALVQSHDIAGMSVREIADLRKRLEEEKVRADQAEAAEEEARKAQKRAEDAAIDQANKRTAVESEAAAANERLEELRRKMAADRKQLGVLESELKEANKRAKNAERLEKQLRKAEKERDAAQAQQNLGKDTAEQDRLQAEVDRLKAELEAEREKPAEVVVADPTPEQLQEIREAAERAAGAAHTINGLFTTQQNVFAQMSDALSLLNESDPERAKTFAKTIADSLREMAVFVESMV